MGRADLQRAVIAARINDPDTAYDQLERAKQIAGRLGEGRNDYNTELAGPTWDCRKSRSPSTSATRAARSVLRTVDARRYRPDGEPACSSKSRAQRRQADEAVLRCSRPSRSPRN